MRIASFFCHKKEASNDLFAKTREGIRLNQSKWDVVVVGGGLAGWIAAVYAAKNGKRTLLVEKAAAFGGRAATVIKEGTALNLGAHAVYRDGELPAVLKELGIELEGGVPEAGGHASCNGKLYMLPGSPLSLLSSRLLSWPGKLELAKLMMNVKSMNDSMLPAGSLADWAEESIREPMVRHLFYTLCRTATYAHRPDIQLAGPVLRQLRHVLQGGVLYLHGGWQTMIERLHLTAKGTGLVTAVTGRTVRRVSPAAAAETSRYSVSFADGDAVQAESVILAIPPAECCRIVEGAERTSLDVWRRQAEPVTAACLDLVMRRLTQPRVQFVMGVDSPFLFTNQSRAATLNDNGLLAVSLLKYHGADQPQTEQDKRHMEHIMEQLQPGWREETAAVQHLPHMTVVHDHPHIGRTELPGPAVPEMPGLYVAGDWAGHRELLADASAASAKRAVGALLGQESKGGRNANRSAV